MSPLDVSARENKGHFATPTTATATRFADATGAARIVSTVRHSPPTPQTATRISGSQSKASSLTVDVATANGGLAHLERPWIRVIYDDGQSSMINTDKCRTYEDVVIRAIQKGKNLHHDGNPRNYCFYTLDGTEAITVFCRELDESELLRICHDSSRKERDRLLLRKTDSGKPQGLQLRNAANLALQQATQDQYKAAEEKAARSQNKVERLMGEPLPARAYPMSPQLAAERERHLSAAVNDLEGTSTIQPAQPQAHPRARKVRELHGARPPSELVVADPATYFPDAEPSELERLNRMSIYRSQRVSRALKTMSIATSRLSMMSDASALSGQSDAPPVPNITESAWFSGTNNENPNARRSVIRHRPFSIVRSQYRDSVTSSLLDTLEEQSPTEPDGQTVLPPYQHSNPNLPEPLKVEVTDPTGTNIAPSFLSDKSHSSPLEAGNSFTSEQLTQALAEDGEAPDEELVHFLQSDQYDDIKYIRGKLIGQGSFGSVYLALHAVTAELMAVKQVELPSASGGVDDKKKNNMVEALKREIALLRELKHLNIVHYLGSSSDDSNLNIFLEYVPGGSIAKMLVDYGSLTEQIVTIYVRQILSGLAYLHSQNVIHRDIKGANILVDNKGRIKISDFGISKRVQDSKTLLDQPSGSARTRGAFAANRVSLQGSVFWMAPEVVQQTSYTRKADIWSLGCLVVEMLTGKHPHPSLSQLQALYKIGGARGGDSGTDPSPDMPDHATPQAREFLKATFRIQHEERPEANDLLEMPWLKPDGGKATQ